MIEYPDFIYLDVYRTGSTHVIRLLKLICEAKPVREHRHSSITKGRPWPFGIGKPVFTTVRNPWDWYVSLWAYGTDGKSAIRRYLEASLDAGQLAALYDKQDAASSFRRWLHFMHDPANLDRLMQEHLPQSHLASRIGLYSYRFLRVTTRYPRALLRPPLVRNPQSALRYHRLNKSYDLAMRNETLEEDLIAFVTAHPKGFRPEAAKIITRESMRPMNFSTRTLDTYRHYYGEAEMELVAERDRFFLDEFGYRF